MSADPTLLEGASDGTMPASIAADGGMAGTTDVQPRRTDPFAPRPRTTAARSPAPAMSGASSVPVSGVVMPAPLTFSEQDVALARRKSYTGQAVVCVVLAFVLWLPGLIATILFRNEAKKNEQIAGQSLPGVGCLNTLFWLYMVSFAVFLLAIVILAASLGG